MSEATDVLQAIDQLRRDLSWYHGQLKAHNDLQVHCDHQRERIVQLEGLYAKAKAENAKLWELCADMLWTIKHAHGWYKNDTHEMLMTDVRGRDGEPTNVSHSLTTDEEMYEKRMRELGVEVTE